MSPPSASQRRSSMPGSTCSASRSDGRASSSSSSHSPGRASMSRADAVAAGVVGPGTPPADATPRRGAWGRLLRSELRLVFGRRRNIALLVGLSAVPLLLGTVLFITQDTALGGQGPGFVGRVTGNGLFLVVAALFMCLPFLLPLTTGIASGDPIAVGLFLSTLTEVPVGAMAATVVVAIVSAVLDTLPQLAAIHPGLLTHHWLDFAEFLRIQVDWGVLGRGLGVQAAWVAIFGALAWSRFTTADVTSCRPDATATHQG